MVVIMAVEARPLTVIDNIGQLLTMAGFCERPKVGPELGDVGLISDAAVVCGNGRILWVGKKTELPDLDRSGVEVSWVDAGGRVAMPGFVDPHTHLVFSGHRCWEMELRARGASYLDILKSGGGILDTVRSTRRCDEQELLKVSLRRLEIALDHGTTTLEIKSGYGLDLETELKQLRVIRRLWLRGASIESHVLPGDRQDQPSTEARLARSALPDVVPTFLGAHAVPDEFGGKPAAFIDFLISDVLPEVARLGLAEFCDVFCEEGAFGAEEAERLLLAAKSLGFQPKIHAEETTPSGGAEVAARVRAISADHLVCVSDQGIKALREASVVAVLLPCTSLFLGGRRYAPARRMIEAGVAVALGTDCNPGSSPSENMQLVTSVACSVLGLLPAEALCAATINAAHAINRARYVGSIEVGKQADIVIFDADDYRCIPYRLGVNQVWKVLRKGLPVVERRPSGWPMSRRLGDA